MRISILFLLLVDVDVKSTIALVMCSYDNSMCAMWTGAFIQENISLKMAPLEMFSRQNSEFLLFFFASHFV